MDKLIDYFRISARVILTIILFTCLSSLASCKKAAPDNGGNTEDGKTGTTLQFKIMSFNIRLYTSDDTGDSYWDNRKTAVIKMMNEQMPDVVGFQEPRDNQRDYLISSLPDYSFIYIHAEGGVTTAQTGHTVMAYKTSKFTVIKGGRFWLSPTPDTPSLPWSIAEDQSIRTCVWAELKENTTGNIVYFFTTHLPYKTADNAARKLAVALCLTKMQSIAEPIPKSYL
jgi:endonuclease/exonuclease/phosphatase family metal-dependent hydrolase